MIKKTKIIPVFIPHIGCPNECYFCNQKKITGHKSGIDFNAIEKEIQTCYSSMNSNYEIEIAFFGGSFTAIDVSIQLKLLKIAYEYKAHNKINRIRISTRPDAIDDFVLQRLKEYKVDIIEIGVQSMNDEVLTAINRGHTAQDVINASHLIKAYQFMLGHQIMPGLYGSSPSKDIETAKASIALKPNIVRIYPTLIIKDTKLEDLFNEGKYYPLSLKASIELISIIYALYEINEVKVIRVGLQPTDNIRLEGDVLGGPFHPSYRQLIMTHIFSRAIVNLLKKKQLKNIHIKSSRSNINYIVGLNGTGKKYIKQELSIERLSFSEDDNSEGVIIICDDKSSIFINRHEIFEIFYNLRENLDVFKRNSY